MSATNRPRIALLGFSIECNRFAPVATEHDFAIRTLMRGDAILEDANSPAPRMLGELPGFIAEMNEGEPWEPVPLLLAMTEPNGPVDHAFFEQLMAEWETRLRAAGKIDGVYCVMHGAGLTTQDDDPEGTIQAMIRRVVGPDVPVVASFDLHANVSDTGIDTIDAYIGYRTNPHMDMRERGAESAQVLRKLIGGMKTHIAKVRLPIIAPTVTMLTGKDAPNRPYGEMIDLGQELMHQPPWAGRIVNVSVMGGFAYADTKFNGMTVADVADNPGGGGRGNTTALLQALLQAGAQRVLLGVFFDPALAAQAHALGVGAAFEAVFNRRQPGVPTDERTAPGASVFSHPARVRALSDGAFVGRKGLVRGSARSMGPSALLDLGDVQVAVITNRQQLLDPAQLDVLGVDLAGVRTLVVKSRGHFRAAFDDFVPADRIVEVDGPGLTTPRLARLPLQRTPRPVWPLDPEACWHPV